MLTSSDTHRLPYTLMLVTLVLLLAFGLRIHDLDAQSLWNDEGNSLRLAQRSIPDLIDATGHDIHPPGYYVLLKTWIGAAGESEFGLRALSVLQGMLTVAVVVALGRTLFTWPVGMSAGLLVALSPFAVYYSQETRMYAQLAMVSAATMWVLVVWFRRIQAGRRARSWALALALVNTAGLYTQYSYPFTMLAQGVCLAGWSLAQPGTLRRTVRPYMMLNAVTLALFLPWLPTAWDQIAGWPRTGIDITLNDQLRTVFTWITYGNTAGDVVWFQLVWPGALALAGLLWAKRREVALPFVWGVIVIGALLVSGAYREANLKFLLPAQIAAALLIGRGAWRLWTTPITLPRLTLREMHYIRRMVATVCLFLVVIGQLNGLYALYTDPDYARPDYRAIAARIMADPRPDDAIILDAPNQAEVFTYYYQGDAPVYALPRGLGGDDAQTRADVQAVIRDHRRIFVVFWGEQERDPNRVVQATLDTGAYPVDSQWIGDIRLAQYAVLGPAPTTPTTQLDARFGDLITLQGYALSADALQPGDVLGVTFFWATDTPLETRYKVTVQLLAPDGNLVSQHDAEPANNRQPTTTWTPNETVIDTHGMIVPPGTAPGKYRVIVGLYDPNAPLERLPIAIADGTITDTVALSPVTVR